VCVFNTNIVQLRLADILTSNTQVENKDGINAKQLSIFKYPPIDQVVTKQRGYLLSTVLCFIQDQYINLDRGLGVIMS
jgi:hypothetical protein